MSKKKTVVSLVLNSLIALVTTGVVVSYFLVESKVIRSGSESFRFFTTDSNILAAVAAATVAVFDIKILRGKIDRLPRAAEVLKYVGTVGVFLTFCTAVFFLAPIYGAPMLFGGTAFHMHAAAPLMSFLSFSFLEKHSRLKLSESLLGLLPVVVYGAVYFVEVVVIGEANGGWKDFYAFNQGGSWGVTVAVMPCAAYAVCLLIRLLPNLWVPKK